MVGNAYVGTAAFGRPAERSEAGSASSLCHTSSMSPPSRARDLTELILGYGICLLYTSDAADE